MTSYLPIMFSLIAYFGGYIYLLAATFDPCQIGRLTAPLQHAPLTCSSRESFYSSRPGINAPMVAGGLPTGLLGTSAGPCSPGATGHPALVARRRHLNVNQKVYLSWCYRLQRDGAMAHTAVREGKLLEGMFGVRVISRFSGRSGPSCIPNIL